MFRARPLTRAGSDAQPGGPTRKAYPFLRKPMMTRIRRPLAYPFLRPSPQKRVRMHTIGDGLPRICPPPFRPRHPPRTRFCDSREAASSKAYPFLRRSTQKWVRPHQRQRPPPSQKWVRLKQASIRQAFGKQAFFPAETGTARGQAAPQHIAPSPRSGAFSDESCDTARPLPPLSQTTSTTGPQNRVRPKFPRNS